MKTIQQTVEFSVSPDKLFDVYRNSKAHSVATGYKAVISPTVGGKFSAFNGALRGRNLAIVPKRMIVQAWRGAYWKKTDLDSILILTFSKARRAGRITLVHANVPNRFHARIKKGWTTYYWNPWKAYFRKSFPGRGQPAARGGGAGRPPRTGV